MKVLLERVGRFRVQELIGEGAMADVYRAFDPGINRTLAIKILKREFRQNREYAGRFLREAKAAGALNHPSIVTVYDVGEVDGYPYIAMELIEGRTLNAVVRERGKLSPEEVVGVGVQLADALRYAHALNVVHRDIKPSNVMLLPDGRSIKILDFGIAHVTEGEGYDEDDGLKTQIGQVLGSPRYMSPEQALGRELDGRSDLFSVGVVLYELATGRKAFSGVSPATLALQITQQEPPPLSEVASDTPRGLQFIINKLLAKRPERRFRDGAQLGEALRREQAASDAVRAEAQTKRRYLPLQVRTTLLVVSITAIALGASIGTVLVRQQAAMQQLAVTFGSAMAAFVANNAALRAADNATLPPDQRDWLPTQAFVEAAASDPNVRALTVVDADGIVRGSKTASLVGSRYRPAPSERAVSAVDGDAVSETADGAGLRFLRPITYAGRPYGRVDLVLSRGSLRSVANLSKLLMGILGLVTLGSVGFASYIVARTLAAPIRRLKAALTDVAAGDLDFRISHNRKDEFGELFDAYNLMSSNLEEQIAATEGYALEEGGERSAPPPASAGAFADPGLIPDPAREPDPVLQPAAAPSPFDDAMAAAFWRARAAPAASEGARPPSPFDPPAPRGAEPDADERTIISPRDG
ncbi:MAG: protein kinase [Caulobacteraceae bacterium]|nr:protein kinase [Caulobacter sp.]